MFSQRVAPQSLRRLAMQHPSVLKTSLSRFAASGAIVTGNRAQIRSAASASHSSTEAVEPGQILARQRLNRPVSPHLSIYRPQITWYGSALHRITGSILSGGLYVFATAYLISPLLGWHLESASIAAAFGALPLAAKFAVKLGVALPFTYHAFNGVRHLVWDLGKQLTNKQVIKTGWTVVGLSVTSAVALALL